MFPITTNCSAWLVQCLTREKRRRVKARKMVFLVTDGKSNRGGHLTIPRAQALKRSGVKIFVVAVGENVRGIDETDRVASYSPKDYIFRVKKLDGFLQIIKLMVQ
ncbi:unnamed protein product, partial [Porites evermanni]